MGKLKQNKRKQNYATPGEPMTRSEFSSFIKEAEKGPFLSEKEFQRKFNTWKKALEK